MGLFRDTIRDARHPVRSSRPLVRRMSDEPVPEPMTPAPPVPASMEEQPDGALTLYRFQKEGQLAPREVPKRVDTGPVQRRHGDPSLGVDRSSESGERVTKSIENAVLIDDGSVIASSRKNGLATGKGDTAHSMRQDSTVNEASSIGLHGFKQQQVSDDLNSVESPLGQHDPVDTYSSDNLQRETGERELSRDAGLGTPSETFSVRWSADENVSPAASDIEPLNSTQAEPKPRSTRTRQREAQAPLLDTASDKTSSARMLDDAAGASTPQPMAETMPSANAADDVFAPIEAKPHDRAERAAQTEPRVSIGQIDVVVVSSAPEPKAPAQARKPDNIASRRYWRRL